MATGGGGGGDLPAVVTVITEPMQSFSLAPTHLPQGCTELHCATVLITEHSGNQKQHPVTVGSMTKKWPMHQEQWSQPLSLVSRSQTPSIIKLASFSCCCCFLCWPDSGLTFQCRYGARSCCFTDNMKVHQMTGTFSSQLLALVCGSKEVPWWQ